MFKGTKAISATVGVKLIKLALICAVFAIPAAANNVSVSYSTTATGVSTYQADTFSLGGQSGSLTLDSAVVILGDINNATLNVGNSGSFDNSEQLTISYDLTLDGVTHTVSQMATWSITPAGDTLFTVAASAPVLFNTLDGSWNVVLDGYSFGNPAGVGFTGTVQTPADFTPVPAPEPASLLLLGTGILGLGGVVRRRFLHS